MTDTKKKASPMARLTIILFVVAAITALLLGLVNYITADRITEIQAEKTADAMKEVMPDGISFERLEYTGSDTAVTAVYKVMTAASYASSDSSALESADGYVVEVAPVGFGGAINMVVGVDLDGNVTGMSIVSMSETSGLGANASREDFRNQYVGGSAPFAVTSDGGEIDALTGATVTSRAVSNGVNSAVAAVKEVK